MEKTRPIIQIVRDGEDSVERPRPRFLFPSTGSSFAAPSPPTAPLRVYGGRVVTPCNVKRKLLDHLLKKHPDFFAQTVMVDGEPVERLVCRFCNCSMSPRADRIRDHLLTKKHQYKKETQLGYRYPLAYDVDVGYATSTGNDVRFRFNQQTGIEIESIPNEGTGGALPTGPNNNIGTGSQVAGENQQLDADSSGGGEHNGGNSDSNSSVETLPFSFRSIRGNKVSNAKVSGENFQKQVRIPVQEGQGLRMSVATAAGGSKTKIGGPKHANAPNTAVQHLRGMGNPNQNNMEQLQQGGGDDKNNDGNTEHYSPEPPPQEISPTAPRSNEANPAGHADQPQNCCIRWNDVDLQKSSMFLKYWKAEKFVDVTLWCEGAPIRGHKLVLAANSTYFERLFTFHDNTPHPYIFMTQIPLRYLKALVEFMYTGVVTIPEGDVPGFLRAGRTFEVIGLRSPITLS